MPRPPTRSCADAVRRCWRRACVGALIALLAGPPATAASLSPDELHILRRSLLFLRPPPSREGTVAITFAASNPASRADAEAIAAALRSDPAGGAALRTRLVDRADLARADFWLVIVAAGANDAAVGQAARAHHALCVTAEVAAVQSGACILAIQSAGRVQILLNHQAAEAAGISFATAFRMMVQEL